MSKSKDIRKYRYWCEAVYERDGAVCQRCGIDIIVEPPSFIVPHHVVTKGHNVSLKYEILNGIVLCESCHDFAHRFTEAFRRWFISEYPDRAAKIGLVLKPKFEAAK